MSEPRPSSLLFINRVFPPAPGATGEMLYELTAELAQRGWSVTVLTAGYQDSPAHEVTADGVEVHRVGGGLISRRSLARRALSYGLLYPALLWKALRLPRHDVVITKTDPPLLLTLTPIIRAIKQCRAVHWAQDLYPEVAEALGVIEPQSPLSRVMLAASVGAMERHDRVVAIGRCMQDRLLERGVAPGRLEVVPNWPLGAVQPVEREDNPFRITNGLDNRFVVMYSGNMGMAHPFEAVLDAAELLRASHPSVLFLLVGDGARRASIEKSVKDRRLTNVALLPFQPKELLSMSLGAADLHLVVMEAEALGYVVPSKIYGALAAGRPCVFIGPRESEAARLILEHACGDVVDEPRGDVLAAKIARWAVAAGKADGVEQRAYEAVAHARLGAVDAFERIFANLTLTAQSGDGMAQRPAGPGGVV